MATVIICATTLMLLVAMERLGLVERCRQIIVDSRAAIVVMTNKSLGEEQKEQAIRAMATRMLASTATIVGLIFVALAGPAVIIAAAVQFALTDLNSLLQVSMSPWLIMANCLLLAAFIYRRRRA